MPRVAALAPPASDPPPDNFRFSVSHVAPGATCARGINEGSGAASRRMQRPVPAPLKILDGAHDRVRRDADAVLPRPRWTPRETGSLDVIRAGLCPRPADWGWAVGIHSKVHQGFHTV
jgi:hypothetical protein